MPRSIVTTLLLWTALAASCWGARHQRPNPHAAAAVFVPNNGKTVSLASTVSTTKSSKTDTDTAYEEYSEVQVDDSAVIALDELENPLLTNRRRKGSKTMDYDYTSARNRNNRNRVRNRGGRRNNRRNNRRRRLTTTSGGTDDPFWNLEYGDVNTGTSASTNTTKAATTTTTVAG